MNRRDLLKWLGLTAVGGVLVGPEEVIGKPPATHGITKLKAETYLEWAKSLRPAKLTDVNENKLIAFTKEINREFIRDARTRRRRGG